MAWFGTDHVLNWDTAGKPDRVLVTSFLKLVTSCWVNSRRWRSASKPLSHKDLAAIVVGLL